MAHKVEQVQMYKNACAAVALCESVRSQHKAWTDEFDAWLGVYAYLVFRQVDISLQESEVYNVA